MSHIILNFHGIGPIKRTIPDGEHDCWLNEDFFEEVVDLSRRHSQVQLTFDDGNASDVEIAMPSLLRHGLQATFFICSGFLDHPTFLSRTQVRELRSHGMSIGSHGVTHLSWRHLPTIRLWEELQGSRQELEQVCGDSIYTAACPFGAYDRAVLSALRQAGYHSIYTSDGGLADTGHWLQARNTLTRSMSIADVELLVQRGPGILNQALIRASQIAKRLR